MWSMDLFVNLISSVVDPGNLYGSLVEIKRDTLASESELATWMMKSWFVKHLT